MVKGGAVLFALMMFTKTNGAASNSEHALAETKKIHEELTALRENVGGARVASKAAEGADEEATDEESTAGEEATDEEAADEHETTTTKAKAKTTATKTAPTTTVKKSSTTTKATAKSTAKTTAHAASGTSAIHWSYEGEGGPENWGELDASYSACLEGSKQSPIDIAGAKVADLPDLEFGYAPMTGAVINNGHTIQVDLKAGDTLKLGGATYNLAQFHFHGPSEHTIGGKNYPLEAHFVHKDATGRLAVVGVLIGEGAENKAFASVLAHLPEKENTPVELTEPLDLKAMLPAVQATYRYEGSLTTPPCSEGVAWNLMAQPITMSKAQITAITSHFAEPNNRPTQQLGSRELQLDISVAVH